MAKSYVHTAGLDQFDTITEARIRARLTPAQCIELCNISERTWYRWLQEDAPTWAIRLIESQVGTLDRFGWKHWEIRDGALYCNQLNHRYHWTPAQLLLPLYSTSTDSHIAWQQSADNLSSLETARKAKKAPKTPENKPYRKSG